jgi:hypothetical protein
MLSRGSHGRMAASELHTPVWPLSAHRPAPLEGGGRGRCEMSEEFPEMVPVPCSPRITLEHVSKRFAAKRALESVTATIHPGEFVAVIINETAKRLAALK